jgi:hypothetical protein
MYKTQLSSGWKLFIVGGCAVFALCGATILGFLFFSAWTRQAAEPPVYAAPQQSYESIPQQDPVYAPEQPYESMPQEDPASVPQPSYETVPQQDPALAPQASIDPDLVGHWRYTEVLASGDFSLVTDYHMVFGSDGTFESYYGDADSQFQNYVQGNWSATDTLITLTGSDGSSANVGYQISNGLLVFEGSSSQVWERISS